MADGKEIGALTLLDRSGADRSQPDAGRWRGRRPGGRPGRHPLGRGRHVSGKRYPKAARRSHRPFRHARKGHAEYLAKRWSSRSTIKGERVTASTIPPRISCMRRCGRCSAAMSCKRGHWSDRRGCVSTSRIPSPVSEAELERIEALANAVVAQNEDDLNAPDVGR